MLHPSRRTALLGGGAAAVVGALPGSKAHAEFGVRPALPIPSELGPNADGMIALNSRLGSMRFQGDQDTATFGVNGPYLGPAVRVRRGRKCSCRSPTAWTKTRQCIGMD